MELAKANDNAMAVLKRMRAVVEEFHARFLDGFTTFAADEPGVARLLLVLDQVVNGEALDGNGLAFVRSAVATLPPCPTLSGPLEAAAARHWPTDPALAHFMSFANRRHGQDPRGDLESARPFSGFLHLYPRSCRKLPSPPLEEVEATAAAPCVARKQPIFSAKDNRLAKELRMPPNTLPRMRVWVSPAGVRYVRSVSRCGNVLRRWRVLRRVR